MATVRTKTSKLRNVVAHIVCGIILDGLAVGILLLGIFNDPFIGLLLYLGCAVPLSITIGSAIHPLTYKGLSLISITQSAIVAWQFMVFPTPGFPVTLQPIQIASLVFLAVVATLPLLLMECVCLFIFRGLSAQESSST